MLVSSQFQSQELTAIPVGSPSPSDSSRCHVHVHSQITRPAVPGRSRFDPATATVSTVSTASLVTLTAVRSPKSPAETTAFDSLCWATGPDEPGLSTRIETDVLRTPSCCAPAFSVPSAPPVLVEASAALI